MEGCKNKMVEISVIIPIYNAEKYLPECLASIERQSFQAFELILVDDGSTDDSLLIAQTYADAHPNVTVISKSNEGPGMTRNRGLSLATGKYVYFLDSDDYIADHTLEEVWEEAEHTQADMVLFSGKSFRETDKPEGRRFVSFQKNPCYPEETWDGMEVVGQFSKSHACFCSVCLQLVRRSLLEQMGMSFGEEIIAEDEYYSFQLLMHCRRVRVLPAELHYRRIRPMSIVTSISYKKHMEGLCICLHKVASWCSSHEISKKYKEGLKYYQARLWKMGIYELYFKMTEEEQRQAEPLKNELLQLGKKYKGFGNVMIYGISSCWPLYRWFRRIRYQR